MTGRGSFPQKVFSAWHGYRDGQAGDPGTDPGLSSLIKLDRFRAALADPALRTFAPQPRPRQMTREEREAEQEAAWAEANAKPQSPLGIRQSSKRSSELRLRR